MLLPCNTVDCRYILNNRLKIKLCLLALWKIIGSVANKNKLVSPTTVHLSPVCSSNFHCLGAEIFPLLFSQKQWKNTNPGFHLEGGGSIRSNLSVLKYLCMLCHPCLFIAVSLCTSYKDCDNTPPYFSML